MRRFDFLYRFLLISFCIFFITKFARKATDTFTIAAISSQNYHEKKFPVHPLSSLEQEEMDRALSQKYHYFGFGGQVYVFFSEDGKYVIKFLKQRLFRPSWLLNHLPLPKILHPFRTKRNLKRKNKFLRDFSSYKFAFDQLQSETGLLYCQLEPNLNIHNTITIVDKIGIEHQLHLDRFEFLLQKKAQRICEKIPKLIQEEKIHELRDVFDQFIQMTCSCIQKGFYNRDPYPPNNCGLLEDRAIQIDVGRFVKKKELEEKENQIKEFFRISQLFEEWLHLYFPQVLPYYYEALNEISL